MVAPYKKMFTWSKFPEDFSEDSLQEWLSGIVFGMAFAIVFIIVTILWCLFHLIIRMLCGHKCCCKCAQGCARGCGSQNLSAENQKEYGKCARLSPRAVLFIWAIICFCAVGIAQSENSAITVSIRAFIDLIMGFIDDVVASLHIIVDGFESVSNETARAQAFRADMEDVMEQVGYFEDLIRQVNIYREMAVNGGLFPMVFSCLVAALAVGCVSARSMRKCGHCCLDFFFYVTVLSAVLVWVVYLVHMPLAVVFDDTCQFASDVANSPEGAEANAQAEKFCGPDGPITNFVTDIQEEMCTSQAEMVVILAGMPEQLEINITALNTSCSSAEGLGPADAITLLLDDTRDFIDTVKGPCEELDAELKELETELTDVMQSFAEMPLCEEYTGRGGEPCPDCSGLQPDWAKQQCQVSCIKCGTETGQALETVNMLQDVLVQVFELLNVLSVLIDTCIRLLEIANCAMAEALFEGIVTTICTGESSVVYSLAHTAAMCGMIGVATIVALPMGTQIQKTLLARGDPARVADASKS